MRPIDFEEVKEDFDGSDNVSSGVYGKSNYDVMEGQSLNDAFEDIVNE